MSSIDNLGPLSQDADNPLTLHNKASKTSFTVEAPPTLASLSDKCNQTQEQKAIRLSSNVKMALGIAAGVLIGTLVLGILAASILSHGAAIPVFGLILAKLQAGGAFAAGLITHIPHLAAIAPFVAKLIPDLAIGSVMLVGGYKAGQAVKSGEAESMDEASKKLPGINDLYNEDNGLKSRLLSISEEDLENHRIEQQSHILSSQAGRNFNEASLKLKLHYPEGAVLGAIKNPIKAFGHFWSIVPYTSLKSIFDKKQYDLYNKNVEREKQLKENSVREKSGDANISSSEKHLAELNEMRKAEIEELLKSNKSIYEAYKQNPQAILYDREIAKLEVLEKKVKDDQIQTANIQEAISRLKAIKMKLLDLESEERSNNVIKSLFSINADIKALKLGPELEGQISEAVAILLANNPEATLEQVNDMVSKMNNGFTELVLLKKFGDHTPEWKYRQSSIEFAKRFVIDSQNNTNPSLRFTIEIHSEKAPMVKKKGFFLKLKALDLLISLIHLTPVPGSAAISMGLTTLATKIKPKLNLSDTDKKVDHLQQSISQTEKLQIVKAIKTDPQTFLDTPRWQSTALYRKAFLASASDDHLKGIDDTALLSKLILLQPEKLLKVISEDKKKDAKLSKTIDNTIIIRMIQSDPKEFEKTPAWQSHPDYVKAYIDKVGVEKAIGQFPKNGEIGKAYVAKVGVQDAIKEFPENSEIVKAYINNVGMRWALKQFPENKEIIKAYIATVGEETAIERFPQNSEIAKAYVMKVGPKIALSNHKNNPLIQDLCEKYPHLDKVSRVLPNPPKGPPKRFTVSDTRTNIKKGNP